MIEKIVLKKSAVLDKMPTTEQLDYGEIALNYNAEHPFLSFKNSEGDIMPLGDYDEDIQDLWDNKLDVSYFEPLDTQVTTNTADIARLKKISVTEVDLIVERKDRRQELSDAKKELNASIAQKADKTDLAKYAKLDDTGQTITADKITVNDVNIQGESLLAGIDNIFGEVGSALDTKADKTDLAKYAKLDDTGQTITVNKLNADDVILARFSVNNLFDTVNENLRINTQQIATLNTKVAELEQKTPTIDLSEYAKKSDIPPQEIYVGDSATAPSTAKMAIDPTEDIMEVCQTTGTSETNVVSQKCFTDNINALLLRIEKLEKALNSK